MTAPPGDTQPLRLVHGKWPKLAERIIPFTPSAGVRIGVAVPIHNNASVLEATVDSIVQNLASGDRVALVENGSSDDSWARMKARYGAHAQIVLAQLTEPD